MKRSSRLSVALHGLVHLVNRPGNVMTSTELGDCMMTNPVVVRRVMGDLRDAGLVASSKGHNGGWQLLKPAATISLRAVYAALGESLLVRTQSDPGDPGCAIVASVDAMMTEFLVDAEALLASRLERMTLADLARNAAHATPIPTTEPHIMDDVLVIGGSFAGLTASLQLVRTGRTVTVLDTRMPRNRFTHAAHGVLGFDGANPWDIRKAGEANVLAYPTAKIVAAAAVSARQIDGGFAVTDALGTERHAKRLILAYGVSDVMPALPGFAQCWGKTVVPCPYCDGYEVANRRLGVLYSSPMSVHFAQLLQDWSPQMTLFSDGNGLDAEARAALAARSIALVETPVVELAHNDGQLQAIQLADGTSVELDAMFAHPRNAPSCDVHLALGIATVDGPAGPVIKVDERQQTSVSGVFACGDAANPMASVTMAMSGGAMAGVVCHQSLVFPPS